VTTAPEHPYTQRLFMAAPIPDPVRQRQRRHDRHRLLLAQRETDQGADAVEFVP
jgi:peptide/nickel transport system ATP-binding protein